MRMALKTAAFLLCLHAATAYARPLPPDAGVADPVPPDAGVTADLIAADTGGATTADAGVVADTGAYPDTGCPDGVCCLVLPDFDASFDTGPVDTGRRRRRAVNPDAGAEPPDEGLFGCSASGVSSLLWLLPLALTRRRRS